MAGLKDSGIEWIGEIPAEWENCRPLRFCASLESATSPFNPDKPYLALENISSWTGEVTANSQVEQVDSTVANYDRNAVLFGKLRPYLAKVVRPMSEGQCSTELLPIMPTAFERDYLFWLLINKSFIDIVNSMTYGVKMPRTSWVQLGSLYCPIPPMGEQKAIAEFLDKECVAIDAAASTLQKQISSLERYRASVIHEAVTRGLDQTVPSKPSGVDWIGEIPKSWELNRMRYLASMESGATPSKDNISFWEGTTPWVSSMEVKQSVLQDTSLHISKEAIESCSTRILPEGTLVMVVRSGILQHTIPVALLGKPMAINQDVKAFTFNDSMVAKYFYYFVKGNNDNLLKTLLKDKSTVDNINQEYLKSLLIPVPPIEEQIRIVNYLDVRTTAIDAVLDTKRKQLDVLKRRRQSLIYEYVTGKRRINQEA